MPVTNPWLAGPAPTARLDHARLSERVLNLLSSQNMCVLAGPLATPVRYFHVDFTVIFTTAAGSPKLRTIAADPRVSVGILAPLVGQASSRGAGPGVGSGGCGVRGVLAGGAVAVGPGGAVPVAG